jgi:GT2 family glycosyltransferase
MTCGELLREISFDLYERYVLLEHIGKLFREGDSKYRVLDIGGHTPALWPGFTSLAAALIPDATVVVVDTHGTPGLQNYVQANGWHLPFRDGTFDLVCSLDILEHVPGEHRPAFLSEVLRVSRDGVYLAFPFDSPSNRWVESLVVEYTNVVLKNPVQALLEHRRFGLPDREIVTQAFANTPHAWIGFGQSNTDVWLLMMLTYHTLRMPGTDFVHELNQRFNQVYAAQDWADPCYRAGYLLSKTRSKADVEAARWSFAAEDKRVDLQSVLSFCQLFLNLAQNARVSVDKSRHIENIERELATYREKRAEGLPDAAGRLRGREQTGLDTKLSRLANDLELIRGQADQMGHQLTGQLELMREQMDALRRQLEGSERLDDRLRDLEIGHVTNKRAIQAIYDSRIWRALCGMGGLLLRVTGRNAKPDRSASWNPKHASSATESLLSLHRDAADDFLELVCDYPGNKGVLPMRDVVEIRGWALAKSGIERVVVEIDGEPPASATYGIRRHDVARNFPKLIEAEYSGFRFFWDTTGLPEGPRTIRVKAIARSGQTREVICHTRIDWKTPPDYGLWIARNEPTEEDLKLMRLEATRLLVRPRISIAVPVYKTPVALLERCIESVLAQTYPEWELCLADDASNDTALTATLQKYVRSDSRIRLVTLAENRGISGATNEALSQCTGEYVAFLDHDDELAPFALYEVVRAISAHPDADLFYSDEDKIDEQGRRYDAFFKPGWSPDLFRSCNYICHFVVLKRALMERTGGLDVTYSGSQDYEFLLRASENSHKIKRIAKVLYHWRAISGSAARSPEEKPGASADGQRALTVYLARNAPGAVAQEIGVCRYRVRYPIAGDPRVSILIPTGGHKNVSRAIDDVLEKTSYKNYEIVVIDNSRSMRVEELVTGWVNRKAPVRYLDWRGKPFNFSRMNNVAVQRSESPYVLFLNDDTTVITNEWLAAMLEQAQRPEIGAVGAELWYPNNLIQHAGVVMGIFGNCSHAFKGLPGGVPHYFDFPNLIRNCSAVTGACMLVSRNKFLNADGFDEVNLAVAFQDVDLCLKLLELGYRNVYTPYARLYHYESATKTDKDKVPDPVEDAFMKKKWAKYIADDPYYNPNLARRKEDFSLAMDLKAEMVR